MGTWEVTNAQGEVVGTNKIAPILGGCVLLEEWQSAGPFSGKSLNIYDAANDRWHQTWVDNGGVLLALDGKLVDGNVRQTWDTSADEGQTWTTQFDGPYTPKE